MRAGGVLSFDACPSACYYKRGMGSCDPKIFMDNSKDSTELQDRLVTVVLDERESVKQPSNFRVCPLGIQLYSPKKFPEFEILEFMICIPDSNDGGNEDIRCTGVVVRCVKDNDLSLYRIWVKFMDLPETKRNQLECLSKTAKLKCPYCENF
jgi:hypothetical protein